MATSGVAAWNYREIDLLQQHGVEIYAYPLKWTEGPFMPKPEWHFRRPQPLRTLLAQSLAIARHPGRYFRLLKLALKMGTVQEFLLANDFSLEMAKVGVKHIHCHFGDRKLYTGYFCSKILDLPLTVTVHAYEILMNPNPAMFKLAASECRAVVVQSHFNKNEIIRNFGVAEDKFRIIRAHGDMSDERMRTSVKFFIAAEFREKKGYDVLFKAIKKLNRDDMTLWVAGRGKLDVRKMAADIGVSDKVVFLGAVGKDFMNILYDACDVFVLPSKTAANGDREGIPATLMEAMSHHKPVISTRHAGIPELVSEILLDENDIDGLADAMAYLADNPDARKEMGERNYKLVKSEYSDDVVLQLKTLYEEMQSK